MLRRGLKVFVVEDEATVSMLLEAYLQDLGCEIVAIASRRDDALQKARTVKADVGLLDVNLAGLMSYPVADVLQVRNIPFIFVTGYGTSGVPPSLSGAPVLNKPFQSRQLAEMLRAVTASSG